jgi:hypothetical protein
MAGAPAFDGGLEREHVDGDDDERHHSSNFYSFRPLHAMGFSLLYMFWKDILDPSATRLFQKSYAFNAS